MEMTVVVERESPDQRDVIAMLSQADARSASLYPAESRHGSSVADLVAANVRFFVARQDGAALGCGGFVLLETDTAEIKRLFVKASVRGQGVGRALMVAIEAAVRAEGARVLSLETGVKSSEALGLYRSFGFAQCESFAAYHPDPLSVFMTKRID